MSNIQTSYPVTFDKVMLPRAFALFISTVFVIKTVIDFKPFDNSVKYMPSCFLVSSTQLYLSHLFSLATTFKVTEYIPFHPNSVCIANGPDPDL